MVVPSRQDNLPNIILEAMSCGTPCIAFHIGGLQDIILHEQTGYLANPEDSRSLSDGIQWLFQDDQRLMIMRHHTRQHIESHFSDDLQVQRYRALYEEILSNTE